MGKFWTVHPNGVFISICIRSDESHWKPGCSQLDVEDALSNVFESNAAGVTNFSIVWRTLRSDKCRRSKRGSIKCGNCKEGKKARHKSNITSFQVNNPYLKFKILIRAVLLGRLNIYFLFFLGGGGGNVELNYSPGGKYILYCFAIVISYCFSPALPCYNQNRHQLLR